MQKTARPKYDHRQSQFYRLRCRRGLATLLNVSSEPVLHELVRVKPLTYRVFRNETGRIIEAPTGPLLNLHQRAAALLRRLNLPDYVHSQKGRSYVTNARAHATNEPTIKTDISGFFTHTTAAAVRWFFRNVMECSPDVARLLGDLLCYEGHVATGSPVSNELAFFANQHIMDAINEYAVQNGCKMTLLVDDITITGPAASKKMLHGVVAILRSANHQVSPKANKTRTYGTGQTKHITGTVVHGGRVKLPNRRQKDLLDAFTEASFRSITKRAMVTANRKLRGHLAEAKSVDAGGISSKFTQPRRRPCSKAAVPVPIQLEAAA